MSENDLPLSPWWSPGAPRRCQAVSRPRRNAAMTQRHQEPGSRRKASPRSRPAFCRSRPAMRPICTRPVTELTGSRRRCDTKRYLAGPPRNSACQEAAWRQAKARIFELARVFRDRERGDLHLPEFTMLEWYRANAPYEAIMADTRRASSSHAARDDRDRAVFAFRGRTADPFADPELADRRRRLRARSPALICWPRSQPGRASRDRAGASRRQDKRCVRIADDDTWSDIFSKILVAHVEPRLGQGRLTLSSRNIRRRRRRLRAHKDRSMPARGRAF